MRELRSGAILALGAVLAGIGPFVLPGPSLARLAAAAAFSIPATSPFFFRDRTVGSSAIVLAVALVMLGSVSGVLVGSQVVRRALLVRNLQMASSGAVAAGLLTAIAWAREVAGKADRA